METLLQNNLGIYYFLMFAILGVAIFCNVSKEKRLAQIGIAQTYVVILVITVLVVIIEIIFRKFLNNLTNISGMTSSVQVFVGVIQMLEQILRELVDAHQIILLGLFVIITVYKFKLKIRHIFKTIEIENIKNKILYKICFDENQKINEKGRIVLKISQNMLYTLIIWYMIVPILLHLEIEIFYSSIITLFLALVFLEIQVVLNVFVSKIEENPVVKKLPNRNWSHITSKLNNSLKHNSLEKREDSNKMILNSKGDVFGNNNLVCEVPNLEQFKNVNMAIMNNAFFENKKILVICLNKTLCNEYYEHLNNFNKDYDGKLAIKILTNEDKVFDDGVDIFISTLEICFGNIKLIDKINTIVIEDIDLIMKTKLELLRAFGNIVKTANSKARYIILTYMLQGIEAAVKNLLLLENITWYNAEDKQQANQLTLNVWDKNNVDIGDIILGKVNDNVGNLVPLALLSTKKDVDRTIVISDKVPVDFQVNEINNIKNLSENKITNQEINELNQRLHLSKREKYFDYKKNNYIVAEDKNYNLYDIIYKLSLINGQYNHINIVSNQYLLRDYMINNYINNKARLKQFLPYIPCEVANSKVILHSLILQLTNFGVNESVLVRVLRQNKINITLSAKNNIKIISRALNEYIKRDFGISIDTYSYIIVNQDNKKFVFDNTKNSFIVNEPRYELSKAILQVLPDTLFRKVNFIKDGFVLDIEQDDSYNFYQKYLPGQKHSFNGSIYKIVDVVDIDRELNAVVEMSTDYDNNDYRQLRIINMQNEIEVQEQTKHDYEEISASYTLGTADYIINTEGYYEFSNGVILGPNESRYITLSNEVKEKVRRNHNKAKVLKIGLSLLGEENNSILELFGSDKKDKITYAWSFIFSEVLASILGENFNYIQVKAKVSADFDFNNCAWVWPIIGEPNEVNSMELYIFEDTELERGLVDIIYKNMDNILELIYDYLKWLMSQEVLKDTLKVEQLNYLTHFNSVLSSCGELKAILSKIVLK